MTDTDGSANPKTDTDASAKPPPDTKGSAYLQPAYDQLCTSFRAIDDFRGKLLGFLPLVTGGGLILLTGPPGDVRSDFFGPVGLFGILVTLGLLAYELNGIKRCLELVEDGKELEGKMGLKYGLFSSRRERPFGIGTKQFAAAWIYPAVLAAWIYLALLEDNRDVARVITPIVFIVGLVGILLYDQSVRSDRKPEWLFKLLRPEKPDQASANSPGG